MICNATGNPIPILAWIHNDQILASSTNQSNVLAEFVSSSTIDSINTHQPNDVIDTDGRCASKLQTKFVIENRQSISAQIKLIVETCWVGVQHFNCIAINKFNKDQQHVNVAGKLKPIFPMPINETLGPVSEGSSITIDCNAIGYPVPIITWHRYLTNNSLVTKVYILFIDSIHLFCQILNLYHFLLTAGHCHRCCEIITKIPVNKW